MMASQSSEHQRLLRRIASLHLGSAPLLPDPTYLDQPRAERSLLREQREAVVNFNTELAEDFGLNPQTAALGMNYFDRYGSALEAEKLPIPRDRVQLISMTCLMLASKFFDRRTPSINDMCKIAQHVYSHDEFRELELDILERLRWLLHVPLPHTFFPMLLRLLELDDASAATAPRGADPAVMANMAKWGCILIDLTGFEYNFLKNPPIVIAMAALLCAARFEAVKDELIPVSKLEHLRRLCSIEQSEIEECAQEIMAYYELCFPNQPKAQKTGCMFLPVQPEDDGCARQQTTTPTSVIPEAPPCLSEPMP